MKYAVSLQLAAVHSPPISEVRLWAAERGDNSAVPLIDLCQAVPDYAPAQELTEYLATLLKEPLTARYSPVASERPSKRLPRSGRRKELLLAGGKLAAQEGRDVDLGVILDRQACEDPRRRSRVAPDLGGQRAKPSPTRRIRQPTA